MRRKFKNADKAYNYFLKAKDIYTNINGKYHEKVARIYNNLVKVYFDKVEFEKA